jgi:hypothetical protein
VKDEVFVMCAHVHLKQQIYEENLQMHGKNIYWGEYVRLNFENTTIVLFMRED